MEYRASRDGFNRHNFHTKCDKVSNTFTIIKATNGNIFGAFSEKAWANDVDQISDPKAFIISLINKENKPFKAMINSGYSKGCDGLSYGPYFGFDTCHKTFDILIAENSNADQSWSNFGYSFKHQDYPAGSEKARNILAGSERFQTIEIEVFTKKD